MGSQSLKRAKVRDGAAGSVSLKRLADVDWEPNRRFLGRFALVERDGGLWPVTQDRDRMAAHLKFGGRGRFRRWLRKDQHLLKFLSIPSKENGLDLEGIVARGDRVWVGLRGPVLGQSAVVLEMKMKTTKHGHLKARRIEGRSRFRRHLVDTDGQGIRPCPHHGPRDVGRGSGRDPPASPLRPPAGGGLCRRGRADARAAPSLQRESGSP